jgi:hypothetical protein
MEFDANSQNREEPQEEVNISLSSMDNNEVGNLGSINV